jgi:phenylpyruvate tautomerase PptA (4-oxalocrotonate tautomerase family)
MTQATADETLKGHRREVAAAAAPAPLGRAGVSGGDSPSAEEYVVPFVNVKLVEEVFTEKQKYEMAAKLTDVMVAFEGSDAFREVVLVLMEELDRDGWQVGSIENARAAVAAGCELAAAQAPVRHR